MFKEVSAAFEILGDDSKRRQYDFRRSGGFPSFTFRSRNPVDDIFDNMFSQFFGDQRPSGSRVRVKITLEESCFGCFKKVRIDNHAMCEDCKGTGSSSWEPCPRCEGRGFFALSEGSMRSRSACVNCGGRGSIPRENCRPCSGHGHIVTGFKEIDLRVPPGVEDGSQVRIVGDGESGEVFIQINVERHESLERRGNFLVGFVEVDYPTLVLGGKVVFNLFKETLEVKVPPRTRPGSQLKVKGKGMPVPQNPLLRGDLLLEVRLMMPEKIGSDHEKMLVKLMKIESHD